MRMSDVVKLNVGGTTFTTSAGTLTGSSSYFQHLYSERWSQGEADECFLDRDPAPFALLLSYMRTGDLDLPENDHSLSRRVIMEAEFLGVDSLLSVVKARVHRNLHTDWMGCDTEAATAFDEEHGGLREATAAGVIPARFFATATAPPAPPRKVVQLLPAPPGMKVRVKRRDVVPQSTFAVHCLALLENPKQLPDSHAVRGGAHLDAFVTHPSLYGPVLASEVFGDATDYFELEPGIEASNLLPLPEGMNLEAEFWRNTNAHNEGTFTRAVRMLRCRLDEDTGRHVYDAVDLREVEDVDEPDTFCFSNPSTWENFKGYKM